MTTKARFSLTLEAVTDPNGPPPAMRLRIALKRLLRDHGLRCIDVHETTTPDDTSRRPVATTGQEGRR